MSTFTVNQLVGLPCEMQPGAFPGEYLVTVIVEGDKLTGFVRKPYIEARGGERGVVKGRVVEVTDANVTVQMPGSFFTTAIGRASVTSKWASKNLEAVPA